MSGRKVILHSSFEKTYDNRVTGFSKQIKLDLIAIRDALKTKTEHTLPDIYRYHNLTGGGVACHIASGFVILFMLYDDLAIFYDIGTHSQLMGYYGKNSKSFNIDHHRNIMYNANKDKEEDTEFFKP